MRRFLVRFAIVCSLLLAARSLPAQIQGGWVNTGTMNTAREGAAQVTLSNGKALVAVLASAEIYAPSTGVWTATGAMATARESFAAAVLKTRHYENPEQGRDGCSLRCSG